MTCLERQVRQDINFLNKHYLKECYSIISSCYISDVLRHISLVYKLKMCPFIIISFYPFFLQGGQYRTKESKEVILFYAHAKAMRYVRKRESNSPKSSQEVSLLSRDLSSIYSI